MIPKIIHYVWLGKNEKPESFKEIKESWTKNAEDFGFEIKEWNEENSKEFDLPEYYYKAVKEKKWAFASDVLRCHILYKYGGIYLDIDEKLLKPIDIFIDNIFFTAYYHMRNDYFGFQFLGSIAKHYLMKEMIEFYNNYREDNYIIINVIFSNILNIYKDTDKEIKIYEQVYFYPEKIHGHDFTLAYGEHLGNTSWVPFWKKILYKIPFYLKIKSIIIFFLPKNIKGIFTKIKYN